MLKLSEFSQYHHPSGVKLLAINIRRGISVLDGIQEIKAIKGGRGDLRTHSLKEPASPQVIRTKLNLSQSAFAGLMGVRLRTVQDWEQGRRKPSGPAEALLRIAKQKPEVFLELV